MSSLARLSPFGPIFTKELRVGSRRKRTYLLRVGYLGLLLLALLWAYAATDSSRGGVAAQAERQQSLGYAFFIAFSIVLVGTVPIVSPVLTSNAIGGERLARTLPVLLMTPITAWQVVGGKLFSRLLTVLMLIGLGLPVLAMVRLLGGVELEQMGAVIALAVSFAFGCASIGLFFSLFISRPAFVILLSYATQGVLYGVLPVCAGMLMAASRTVPGRVFFQIFAALNPFFGTGTVLIPQNARFLPTQSLWIWSVAGQLVLGCLLTALTASLLRKQIRKQAERPVGASEQLPADPIAVLAIPPVAAASPVALTPPALPPPLPMTAMPPALPVNAGIDPGVIPTMERQRSSASVADNPVLWRELRRPLLKKPWHIALAIGLFSGIMGLLYISTAAAGAMDEPELQIFFVEVFLFVWWLLAAVLAGTSSTGEKETDTWTLLLATPLSGAQIVWGKFAGVMRRMWIPSAIVTLHFFLFSLGGVIPFWSALLAVFLIVSTGTLWVATGVAASLWARRMTVAVICGLLPAVLLYGVLPLVVLIPAQLVSRRGERAAEQTMWINPYFFSGSMFDGVRRQDRYASYDGSDSYFRNAFELPSGRGSTGEFIAATTFCSLLHLAAAAGVLVWASRVFDPLAGRAGRRRSVALIEDGMDVASVQAADAAAFPTTAALQRPVPSAATGVSPTVFDAPYVESAGLLRRAVASVIDAVLLQLVVSLIMFVVTLVNLLMTADEQMSEVEASFIFQGALQTSLLLSLGGGWLILAILESSRLRATPGKWILGMHVSDEHGHRVPLPQSLLRNLLKLLTILPLGLGAWLALGDGRRRTLYDRWAKSDVRLR